MVPQILQGVEQGATAVSCPAHYLIRSFFYGILNARGSARLDCEAPRVFDNGAGVDVAEGDSFAREGGPSGGK